jgi:hypothetical protein
MHSALPRPRAQLVFLAASSRPMRSAWLGFDHGGGFSLDASVRIEGQDRAGLERLLRNSRPPALRPGAARAVP